MPMKPPRTIGLRIEKAQKLVISPQLQHAIKLLQLSSLDLLKKVETELAENPFLEESCDDNLNEEDIAEKEKIDYTIAGDYKKESNNNEDNFFEDYNYSSYTKNTNLSNTDGNKQQFLENAFAVEVTTYEHLISQLRIMDISEEDFKTAEIIISSLSENGYLETPIEEISNCVNRNTKDVLRVLKIIQNLEPCGIGARNLKETLLIQIEQLDEKNELSKSIIKNDLKLLERSKFKQIASKYSVDIKKIKEAIKVISRLDPIPARQFNSKKIRYIVPDIVVKRVESGYSVSVNDYNLPLIRLNSSYKSLLHTEKVGEDAKHFFNNKYSEAKLLLSSLEKRKSTVIKVVKEIIDYQKDFFNKGPQFLKPLVLKDIAKEINMHESTISRVVANKYMETPWGIFSLKYFFSSKIGEGFGQVRSSRSIKEIIKEIIANEKTSILSDDQIVKVLENRGIKIARRTVAKYRKKLKILSSFQRREKLQLY